MGWIRIKNQEQFDNIELLDTLLRYPHQGSLPEELVGETHGESWKVIARDSNKISIERHPYQISPRDFADSIFGKRETTVDEMLRDGNWFIDNSEIDGSFKQF